MNIQQIESGETVIFSLQEPGDRIRKIGFTVDPAGRGHRIDFTEGMVDGRIKNMPIGLLFQHWLDLTVEQPCHLCAFEEALALLEKGDSCTTESFIGANETNSSTS